MDFFHEAVDSSFFIDYSKLVFGLFRFGRDFEEVLYTVFFFLWRICFNYNREYLEKSERDKNG